MLENGTRVGELAKGLFGKYEDVQFNEDLNVRIKQTQELMKIRVILLQKPHSNMIIIFAV